MSNINFKKTFAKPDMEKWYPYILATFIGFTIADLGILMFRDKMLPGQPPAPRTKSVAQNMGAGRGAFNTIISRNILSSDGLIPDQIVAQGTDPNAPGKEPDPVPSNLPITLIGTLVHSNPDKSIATVELKSKNQVLSYTPKKDIEGVATLVSVERGKIIIRNSNSNALEYIEMKDASKMSLNVSGGAKGSKKQSKSDVTQVGENHFSIKKTDLNKYIGDMTNILQQARVLPNRDPNTGEINGYRIVDIQADSIFTRLGLKRMDVIQSVNGEAVTDPTKAMELFNQFKNKDKVLLTVERDGKKQNLEFSVTQ